MAPPPPPPLAPPPPRRADPPHTPPIFSCRFSPPRPSTSTPSRRTSPPLSRRSLTRSTRPPGTAWWGATLVRGERRRGEVGGERGDQRVRGRACAWGAQPAPHGGFSLLFLFTPRLLRHPRDQALYLLLHRCVHGARRDEGRCCEGERENAAHDLPTCSHPPPFFFLSLARSLSSQASTPSSCSSPGDAITLTFVFLEERERACARAGRVCVGLV